MFINRINSPVLKKKPFTKKYKRLINDNVDPYKLKFYDVNLNNQILEDKIKQDNVSLLCFTIMLIFYYGLIIKNKILEYKKK